MSLVLRPRTILKLNLAFRRLSLELVARALRQLNRKQSPASDVATAIFAARRRQLTGLESRQQRRKPRSTISRSDLLQSLTTSIQPS